MNKWMYIFVLLLFQTCFSQKQDTLNVAVDSLVIETDTLIVNNFNNEIINAKSIQKTLDKLKLLQQKKDRKIRIVHIGDSHIQADFATGVIRQNFQNKFGNAGLGFAFPYKLAGVIGTSKRVKFTSNSSFESYKIIKPKEDKPVGISGVALFTDKKNFSIELNVKEPYKFNTIRLTTPNNENTFYVASEFSTTKELIEEKIPVKTNSNHKIKKGEVLSKIAQKYNISVSELKQANGLKSDKINYGKTLKIPNQKSGFEIVKKEVTKKDFIPLKQVQLPQYFESTTQNLIESIYLFPNKTYSNFALNGVILENNNPGVTYSSIGINGAKCSDYNKYDLFYNQLSALEPDLIIISLGTNESFDKLGTESFIFHLNNMIENIKKYNTSTEILITTPLPSQFKRKYKNTFEESYSKAILDQATQKNYAVWDMYQNFGGSKKVNANFKAGIINSDKVHYTLEGYKKQGNDFFEAFIKAFETNNKN